MSRIPLPHGCSCTGILIEKENRYELPVSPKNWKKPGASTNRDWYIHYRFYDPSIPGFEKGKQVQIKGMNQFKSWSERRDATVALMQEQLRLLIEQGYNHITGQFRPPADDAVDTPAASLSTETPFIDALTRALQLLTIEREGLIDMRSTLKYIAMSAALLGMDKVPIGKVRRVDIISILDNCQNLKVQVQKKNSNGKWVIVTRNKIWTPNQFNHYRKHLGILYRKLNTLEVLEYNPIDKIPIRSKNVEVEPVDEKPKYLTLSQRTAVNDHIARTDPYFRRFLEIFYHSGARRTEIMRVQGKHVDLRRQRFRVLVKKGKKGKADQPVSRWVWKTIKDVALPLWIEAMEGCGPDDYVFSKGLVPGPAPINPNQVTRRWKRHVKEKLGIDANFYWLKHTHTAELNDALIDFQMAMDAAVEATADHNSHTSGAMVVKIYDSKMDARKHNRVKAVKNAFAAH